MNDNYLVLNGKRVDLTAEQIKTLGIIEKEKNPFDRAHPAGCYFYINEHGRVESHYDTRLPYEENAYKNVNYFTDKAFAQQVSLQQLLHRKLMKFAYDNNCVDTADWNLLNFHWTIRYSASLNKFDAYCISCYKASEVYFSSEEDAKRAIEEVVKPFVKEHPNFIW